MPTYKRSGYAYKLTRLMPKGKTAPKGALYMEVTLETGPYAGMLVKAGCAQVNYDATAKALYNQLIKKVPNPEPSEFDQAIEDARKAIDAHKAGAPKPNWVQRFFAWLTKKRKS